MQDHKHKNDKMKNIKSQFIQCDSIKASIPKVEMEQILQKISEVLNDQH